MDSIYGKESYSQSKCVFLAGPIEAWWDTEEEPNKFKSIEAQMYFRWREILDSILRERGYLVYRPHLAFGGNWNEKMEPVHEFVIALCDALLNLKPPGVVALGTDHEVRYATSIGVPVLNASFQGYGGYPSWGWDSDAQDFAHRVADALDKALSTVLH